MTTPETRASMLPRVVSLYSSVSSSTAEDENFSLESLQQRMNNFRKRHSASCRLALVVAGGGGSFLSTLAATPGASSILLEGTLTYDRESYRQYVQRNLDSETFRYCSAESASFSSLAALKQALKLSAAGDPQYGHFPLQNMTHAIGVGCASALRSDTSKRNSRAFVAVSFSDARQVAMKIDLVGGDSDSTKRSRFEEDVFVSHCILTCLEHALESASAPSTLLELTTGCGDQLCITLPIPARYNPDEVVRQAADKILCGEEEAVSLIPTAEGFKCLTQAFLPPKSLVFPGSFNPPHEGHVKLVQAALTESSCQVAWFELSITNADKPSLASDEIVRRIQHFLTLADMPERWGILLTNAPLFKQKVDILQPQQVVRSFDQKIPLHMVIGTDTLVRLLNPKYYNDCEEQMIAALDDMACHFVVGGRVQQKLGDPDFVSGEDDVRQLPERLRAKFTLLKDFRVDISSTDIRDQMKKARN